eukprot:CAMPEP_0181049768 /NCGR_PEP_ID=MMETSP1070-20121207/16163_1 /TAXON_ID=265543 /ORGANISM="Minutocellus polymorphus, Strain NH13" /LENGTH=134 /DNA_ID=CAMNT_0023128677 /DNA_START=109 /DNA_END=513 /DNA_ORIENTATION=+
MAAASKPAKPKPTDEEKRIRMLFPTRLPTEIMARIEYLSTMNCIREVRKILHAELLGKQHYLVMVDREFLDGMQYTHAVRLPGLISGSTSSEAAEWDTDDDDENIDNDEDPGNPGALQDLLYMEGWQDVGGNLE